MFKDIVQGKCIWLNLLKIFEDVLRLSFTDNIEVHVLRIRLMPKY
jgi:hypothetical protein